MTQPRSNVVITGVDHRRNLTAEIEAGEVNVVKYLFASYRRACREIKKTKVLIIFLIKLLIMLKSTIF